MGMFSPETEALRQRLAQQMTHATGQSGGEWIQAKQRMNLLPPWYQTLSGESAGQGFTEALQAINQNRGDLQIGDTSINPIDFVNPVAGIFGGKLAKTADLMALREAMNRASAGDDAQKIWQDTGWFKSPDGQWRFEIDDSASQFSPRALEVGDWPAGAGIRMVGDDPNMYALQHPQLAAAYPETGQIKSAGRESMGSNSGSYQGPQYDGDPGMINIGMNRFMDDGGPRSTALHELQHAIQQREGFARGGSTDFFSRQVSEANQTIEGVNKDLARLSRAMDEVRSKEPWNTEKLEKLKKRYDASMEFKLRELVPKAQIDPYDAYRRLAGEAEARAVQSRMNLTPEQRRMRFPLDDYDVPVDELIMRYGDGTAMSVDNIQQQIRDKHGLKTFFLSERDPSTLTLNMIEVDKAARGQGKGSGAMRDLVDYADSQGKRIYLNPGLADDLHGTTSRNRLVKFYKRFGFVENKGRNKDFTMMGGMYRDPK